MMTMERPLMLLSHLKESGFGVPHPRHGLNLLWWFVHECMDMPAKEARCNPANGDFGFYRLHNVIGLLPYTILPFYEVGNVYSTDSLPDYVTEHFTGRPDLSNFDRIIVSYNPRSNRFAEVYVTRHIDRSHFDRDHTFEVSYILSEIYEMNNREDFLREMNYLTPDQTRVRQINTEEMFTSSAQSLHSPPIMSQMSHEEVTDEMSDQIQNDNIQGHFTASPQSQSLRPLQTDYITPAAILAVSFVFAGLCFCIRKYYEVGNLNYTASLPDYVTGNYTGHSDDSNCDRIIASYDSGWDMFGEIYVTRHSDQRNFDQNHTYRISTDLLKAISLQNNLTAESEITPD
ncbi:uncharacterized protein LOC130225094 [Danio aesculapii]|uniref:uncharacterized protein LOC130225094 n=1 Tax=Danio aesculapii TaxID=1142201 RepID=UPI0024BFD067|nr:uncharacterized protein LOC130225094 [Danio aesculapii]